MTEQSIARLNELAHLKKQRPLTPEVLTHWAETLSQPLFGQPFSCTLAQVPSRQEAMERLENEMRLMR